MAGNSNSGVETKAKVREDCRAIRRLLARGQTETEIRDRLKLSRDLWRRRLKTIGQMNLDPLNVWVDYKLSVLDGIEELARDRQSAREAEKYGDAARCTKMMMAAKRDIVEVGQTLGQYAKAADKLEVESISLGLFHEDEPEDMVAMVGGTTELGN